MKTQDRERQIHRSTNARVRRPDLQGMRAVAVLAVFADHLFGWPSGGFVGVDVFFVLSGFFITGLLIRERTLTRSISFQDFYVRRVKRIVPSAVLVLVVTVAASYVLLPALRAKDTLIDGLYAALFVSNFRFEALGADYFQQGQPPSPLQHFWSLSIEEQFYFVWPAVLAFLFFLTKKVGRRGNTSVGLWTLFATMLVVVTASYSWATFLSAHDPNSAYFSTFTRAWELGVGALLAIAGPWFATIPSAIRPWLAWAGLAGVVASLFIINPTVQFPAPWAALPVLATALVVASFHGGKVRGMKLLTNPVASYIGDTSYTLYLWHWPVIVILESLVPRGPFYYGLTLGLVAGLTALTYRFFENPIRESDWLLEKPATDGNRLLKLRRSGWAIVGGLGAAAALLSILGINYFDKISAARAVAAESLSETQQIGKVDPCFGAPAMLNADCALRDPGVPLQPNVNDLAKDHFVGQCYRGEKAIARKEQFVKSCTYGYMGSDATRIAIIGDSHAAQIMPALLPILDANKWQLSTYLGTGCKWRLTPNSKPDPEDCPMEAVQKELLADPYDLVLTTSIRGGDVDGHVDAWVPVSAAGSKILALADSPANSEDSYACVTRFRLGRDQTGDCGTPRSVAFARPDPLIAAATLVPGTTLMDLTPYYCRGDRCPSVIGNVIVYRDVKGHVSATFARTLAPAIEDGIRRALGE